MQTKHKKIPIGISDFRELIMENYYYVDKSALIQELINAGSKVTLFPRPRRFGKTLNLSMLRYFFEKNDTTQTHLFDDLAIGTHQDIMAHQGQYPVIFLTFKDVKHPTWQANYKNIIDIIAQEYRRHAYLTEGNALDDTEKKQYSAISTGNAQHHLYTSALAQLSRFLTAYHGKRTVILMDEYDAPLHAAFEFGYYDDCVNFLRPFMSGGFKDNNNLHMGIITGILRIAKESIFSGLNNLKVCSLTDQCGADHFGFTQDQVTQFLADYGLQDHATIVQEWYDGYMVGMHQSMYNPWSVINYVDNHADLRPYWINTSQNALIKELMRNVNADDKEAFQDLIAGNTITKPLYDAVSFDDVFAWQDCLWSFLLFTGYLTYERIELVGRTRMIDLRIPNQEVHALFETIVSTWFQQASTRHYSDLLKALVAGDMGTFAKLFVALTKESFSYFDVGTNEPERFYHAFVLGLLVDLRGQYQVTSNRESGYGRYDVMLVPQDTKKIGYIVEFKKIDPEDNLTLEEGVELALKQVMERDYATQVRMHGVTTIIALGIAFAGKQAMVKNIKI